jgi:hypothetical protein
MPNDDVAVFTSVLQALEDVRILSDVVIIGGWAQHLYRRYFHDPPELSAMRTVDIDILFRRPPGIRPTGSIDESLQAAGFEREIAGDGSTKFTSREAEVEFLIPDRGRGDSGPYRIRELSIGAQSLRHLDMLTVDTIEVRYGRHSVRVPDPIRFLFHKLLISKRRTQKDKREKDRTTAFELAALLSGIPEWRASIADRFQELPRRQQVAVLSLLREADSPAMAAIES